MMDGSGKISKFLNDYIPQISKWLFGDNNVHHQHSNSEDDVDHNNDNIGGHHHSHHHYHHHHNNRYHYHHQHYHDQNHQMDSDDAELLLQKDSISTASDLLNVENNATENILFKNNDKKCLLSDNNNNTNVNDLNDCEKQRKLQQSILKSKDDVTILSANEIPDQQNHNSLTKTNLICCCSNNAYDCPVECSFQCPNTTTSLATEHSTAPFIDTTMPDFTSSSIPLNRSLSFPTVLFDQHSQQQSCNAFNLHPYLQQKQLHQNSNPHHHMTGKTSRTLSVTNSNNTIAKTIDGKQTSSIKPTASQQHSHCCCCYYCRQQPINNGNDLNPESILSVFQHHSQNQVIPNSRFYSHHLSSCSSSSSSSPLSLMPSLVTKLPTTSMPLSSSSSTSSSLSSSSIRYHNHSSQRQQQHNHYDNMNFAKHFSNNDSLTVHKYNDGVTSVANNFETIKLNSTVNIIQQQEQKSLTIENRLKINPTNNLFNDDNNNNDYDDNDDDDELICIHDNFNDNKDITAMFDSYGMIRNSDNLFGDYNNFSFTSMNHYNHQNERHKTTSNISSSSNVKINPINSSNQLTKIDFSLPLINETVDDIELHDGHHGSNHIILSDMNCLDEDEDLIIIEIEDEDDDDDDDDDDTDEIIESDYEQEMPESY